jgi:hypothetical protein
MTIQAQKLELVKLILDIEDKSVLNNFIQLIKVSKEDWWDKISEGEKKAIEEGLAELDKGMGIPHEEVMKKYKKWL